MFRGYVTECMCVIKKYVSLVVVKKITEKWHQYMSVSTAL
jgi:hypothetical protein